MIRRALLGLLITCAVMTSAGAEPVAVVRAPLRIHESERRIDHTSPSRPTVMVRTIGRGGGVIDLGNGLLADRSDSEFGTITLLVGNVSDDRTPADSLGYQFDVIDGTLPEGLELPDFAFIQSNRAPYFQWDDGMTWDQEPFSFRVVLRLVDWAGNESAPSDTLTIANDGDTTDARLKMEQELR